MTSAALRSLQMEDTRLRLEMANELGSLEAAQIAVREFLARAAVKPRATYQTELVFEELATNAIRYGFPGRGAQPSLITVELKIAIDEIVLTMEDEGDPFDPVQAPERPLPANLGEARIGGLGLRLIRATAKHMTYARVADRNRVMVCIEIR